MSLYGWLCIVCLGFMMLFSSIHIADEGRNHTSWESLHGTSDVFYKYAEHARDTVRAMQTAGSLTTARPAYVRVLGVDSQAAGSPLDPAAPMTGVTAVSVARLGLGNILVENGPDEQLFFIWASPQEPSDAAKIHRTLNQGGSSVFYVRDGTRLVRGGRPGEPIPVPAAAQAVIPDGAIVLIQHPVEK